MRVAGDAIFDNFLVVQEGANYEGRGKGGRSKNSVNSGDRGRAEAGAEGPKGCLWHGSDDVQRGSLKVYPNSY